ncbi:MAG: hypothetical protein ACRDMV_01055 [Streptosporangiales bacterium]
MKREYHVMINGLPHRQLLTDEVARRLGAKPVEKKPKQETAKVVDRESEPEKPRRSHVARTKD